MSDHDLPRGGCVLTRDDRAIKAVVYPDDSGWTVGTGTVQRIVAYDENGSMSHVPWLAVFDFQDQILARVPAHLVTVTYQ